MLDHAPLAGAGMTITMDRRSGIRRLKVSTNNSEAISSERCTFWDTRLNITKFNVICLAFINADRPGAAGPPAAPEGPPAARRRINTAGEFTPEKRSDPNFRPLTVDDNAASASFAKTVV